MVIKSSWHGILLISNDMQPLHLKIWFDFFFFTQMSYVKSLIHNPVVRRYVLPSYTVIQVGIKVVEGFFFFRYNAWGNLIQHVRKLKINKGEKKKAWLSLETNRKNSVWWLMPKCHHEDPKEGHLLYNFTWNFIF